MMDRAGRSHVHPLYFTLPVGVTRNILLIGTYLLFLCGVTWGVFPSHTYPLNNDLAGALCYLIGSPCSVHHVIEYQ